MVQAVCNEVIQFGCLLEWLVIIFVILQCCTDTPYILDSNKQQIDTIFGLATLEEMFSALEADGSDWATKTLETLKKMVLSHSCIMSIACYEMFNAILTLECSSARTSITNQHVLLSLTSMYSCH